MSFPDKLFESDHHHHNNHHHSGRYNEPAAPPPSYAHGPIYGGAPSFGPQVYWRSVVGRAMPSDAIPLGQDTDGAALYATRVPLEGGLHIGKARSDGICYVSYGGREIQIPHHTPHEVLCGSKNSIQLIPCSGNMPGHLIQNAVEGGREANGEPLFVGVARTHYRGTPVGKCGPAMCALNYAYGGEEHQEHQYSVLVYATPVGGPGVSMNYW